MNDKKRTWDRQAAARCVAAVSMMVACPAMLMTPAGAAPTRVGYDANPDILAAPYMTDQVLTRGNTNGFSCYRIPSLTVTPKGTILAVYDGRPENCKDAPQANSIIIRRSTDNGTTFGPQEYIAKGQPGSLKHGYSDPSTVVDWDTGALYNFHVKSFDKGLGASVEGTDPTDRSVLQAAYNVSHDDGVTWSADHVITDQITPDARWRSRFATSGNGIQLRYTHPGRLVQPAAIVVKAANGHDEWKNVAWISDDHGATWHAGTPFSTVGDENKMVELSDGQMLDNARRHVGAKARDIAYSTTGGDTFTEPVPDAGLPDPHNNASIIRAFPNAPKGSARAKVLLFSNTADTSKRINPTIRMSCDDGVTWPISKRINSGKAQYTSLATLPDGSIGLLWENPPKIHFTKFNLAWLGDSCLPSQRPFRGVRPALDRFGLGFVADIIGAFAHAAWWPASSSGSSD